MKNYNEIMTKVKEAELGVKELLELIEVLIEENTMLREQLGMSVSDGNDNLSLREAFDAVSLEKTYTDSLRQKTRAFNCFARCRVKSISEFKGKSIYDLLEARPSIRSCAIMIVLLEHFGVKVEQLDSGCSAQIKKIREEVSRVRESIVFTK